MNTATQELPTIDEALTQVESACSRYDKDEVVHLEKIEIGQSWCQGDVNITRVDPALSIKNTPVISSAQIVEGSSKGSRHILNGGQFRIKLIKDADGDPLMGGHFDVLERTTLTHPEHRHVSFPPGVYQVRYQQDLTAEELRRVMD